MIDAMDIFCVICYTCEMNNFKFPYLILRSRPLQTLWASNKLEFRALACAEGPEKTSIVTGTD